MAYEPTPGIFENGRIADATEILNEFTAISAATKENTTHIDSQSQVQLEESKKYTDTKLAAFTIDGGVL